MAIKIIGVHEDQTPVSDLEGIISREKQNRARTSSTVSMTSGPGILSNLAKKSVDENPWFQVDKETYGPSRYYNTEDQKYYNVFKPANKSGGFGGILKTVAPLALSFIPGMQPLAAAAIGAGIGAAGGGGLKGALLGGLGGYVGTAGLGNTLGSIGSGISNVTGGALGSLGSGVSKLGSVLSGFTGGSGGGLGNLLGHTAGTTLDKVSGVVGAQGPTMGTGLAGALSGGGLSALTSGGGAAGLGTLARIGGSLYGANQEDEAQKRARDAMLSSIAPYRKMGLAAQEQLFGNLSAGFNPGDLSTDPGYQFRLKQGQDALNASLAAQGMGQSGAAMKAAQEYGQGFAADEYSNAYDRWLSQNQQLSGLGDQGLATAAASGNTLAAYQQQKAEAKNRRISEILSALF